MNRVNVSLHNRSIMRIDEKCVDCGICLQTCKKNNGFSDDCINCGQCILSCPTGALTMKESYHEVFEYLKNPEYKVIVSTSPSVRVAIGDEFGFEPGKFLEGKMVSSLKKLGFDYVFDTTFAADLTVMEEAAELIKRIESKQNLPQLTSCCPSWVLYMEKYHSDDLNLLSTCKSPIGMQGMIIKNYFAKLEGIDPSKIINVALTPCVSKKSEIKRPEIQGMDFVITTSELACMLKEKNVDFASLPDMGFDSILGKGSGGGVIFGASGGVMESALRCAYYLLHKTDAPAHFYQLEEIRGSSSMKEATVDMGGVSLKVLVINEIENVEKVYSNLKDYDFVEVMTCPGGCIGGAGQPKLSKMMLERAREQRIHNLYIDDSVLKVRNAYKNPNIQKVYQEYLEQPMSEKSEELLHTTYQKKEKDNFVTL